MLKRSLSVVLILSQVGMTSLAFSNDTVQSKSFQNSAEVSLLGNLLALQGQTASSDQIAEQNSLLNTYFASANPAGSSERLIEAATQMNIISASRSAALEAKVQASEAMAVSSNAQDQAALQSNIQEILANGQDGAQFSAGVAATCAASVGLLAGAGATAYWGYQRGQKNENSGWGGLGVEAIFFTLLTLGGVGVLACATGATY